MTTDLVVIPFRERWELKFKFFTEANFKQFKRNSKFLKQNEKVLTNPPYYEQYTFVGGGEGFYKFHPPHCKFCAIEASVSDIEDPIIYHLYAIIYCGVPIY